MAVNKPWGTIEKPPFELGYQKLTEEEVEDVVERLSQPKRTPSANKKRRKPEIERRELGQDGIKAMVARLANKDENLPRTPDRSRLGLHKEQWGNAVNSYAWHGKNWQAILCGEESP